MQTERPDPDILLSRIKAEQARSESGRLKVFLGSNAGVGKSYAMLQDAREQAARGIDVVVGVVETHGRKETEALTDGLEILPLKQISYKSTTLSEFDLDAAIQRRPTLILVDELAHTNAPGSRHAKRYLDILELLRNGINVHTAVNIQHFESLNDVVAQITGVMVRETVPDSMLDRADDVEVVDIPPDELIQRLKDGKVYIPDRIEHALQGFFRKENLAALRELTLRRVADRVDSEVQSLRAAGKASATTIKERILVCLAPNPLAPRLVRTAARMAASAHAEVVALFVENDRQRAALIEQARFAQEALELAQDFDMETVTLAGPDIVHEILHFARRRHVTTILVAKQQRPRWQDLVFGSVVDEIVRQSGEIDVHVVTSTEPQAPRKLRVPEQSTLASFGWTALAIGLATCLSFLLYDLVDRANLIMPYLLAVVIVASQFGRKEAFAASFLGVLLFDVCFVPPRFSLAVSDVQYIFTFAVMLLVALLLSSLTVRLKQQATSSVERERRTASLYSLSRELSRKRGREDIAQAAVSEIQGVFDADAAVFLVTEGRLSHAAPSNSGFESNPQEKAVAEWVALHGQEAGLGTETLPSAQALYLPLKGGGAAMGVLAFCPEPGVWPLPAPQLDLLKTFANSVGLALERAALAKESQEARISAESERIRNALLSSISHDLRTPLTTIAGLASSLKDKGGEAAKLAESIYDESIRLNIHIENLLDMTRLQGGAVALKDEWQSLEELVGGALRKSENLLEGRKVTVDLPTDLPLLKVDGALIEKVLLNLLENASKHTPPGTPISISASVASDVVRVDVADRGPGLAKGEETEIFEKFFQPKQMKTGGFGLGLAICRTIMRLHRGVIWARNRPDGPGAVFHLEFPKPRTQPEVPVG